MFASLGINLPKLTGMKGYLHRIAGKKNNPNKS